MKLLTILSLLLALFSSIPTAQNTNTSDKLPLQLFRLINPKHKAHSFAISPLALQVGLASLAKDTNLNISNEIAHILPIRKRISKITINKFLESQQIDGEADNEVIMITNSFESSKNHRKYNYVNVALFHGNWLLPFQRTETLKAENFAINSKKTIKVPMMYTLGYFRRKELNALNATMLEIPYTSKVNLSLFIILPNQLDQLDAIETNLENLEQIATEAASIAKQKVHVYLPKFLIHFQLKLRVLLQKIGIKNIFNMRIKSKIINDITHSTVLIIDEGENIPLHIAVPVINDGDVDDVNAKEFIFKANHSFYFTIRNTDTVFVTGHYRG